MNRYPKLHIIHLLILAPLIITGFIIGLLLESVSRGIHAGKTWVLNLSSK